MNRKDTEREMNSLIISVSLQKDHVFEDVFVLDKPNILDMSEGE